MFCSVHPASRWIHWATLTPFCPVCRQFLGSFYVIHVLQVAFHDVVCPWPSRLPLVSLQLPLCSLVRYMYSEILQSYRTCPNHLSLLSLQVSVSLQGNICLIKCNIMVTYRSLSVVRDLATVDCWLMGSTRRRTHQSVEMWRRSLTVWLQRLATGKHRSRNPSTRHQLLCLFSRASCWSWAWRCRHGHVWGSRHLARSSSFLTSETSRRDCWQRRLLLDIYIYTRYSSLLQTSSVES